MFGPGKGALELTPATRRRCDARSIAAEPLAVPLPGGEKRGDRAMQSGIQQSRFRVVKCVLCGGLAGLIAGEFGGPVVVLALMYVLHNLYGAEFSGLELLVAPNFGVIVGVPEGLILGGLWALKPRHLTLWWLMVVVAVSGLLLGLIVYNVLLGLMALVFPFMMAILVKTVGSLVSLFRAERETQHEPSSQSTAWLYEVEVETPGTRPLRSRDR